MAHYAQTEATPNPNLDVVVQVIVADEDFIATGALGDPAAWVQTSYNTRANMHYDSNGIADAQGFRGNYAGVGYTYDSVNDVFYAPQPAPEYVLDTDTWTWWNPTDPEATKPVKDEIPPPPAPEPIPEPVPEPIVEEPVVEETPVQPEEPTPEA